MKMGRDLKRELEHFDGTYPQAWQPDPGDILVGKIVKIERAPCRFGAGGMTWVLCIEKDEGLGAVSLWLTSTVLLNEFRKLRPKQGERIGIKYLGMRQGADNTYKAYAIRIDRPEEEPDFEPLGGEERLGRGAMREMGEDGGNGKDEG